MSQTKGSRLNRKKYVQLLNGIQYHEATGHLEIEHAGGNDTLTFVRGTLCDFSLSQEEPNTSIEQAISLGITHKKARWQFTEVKHLSTVSLKILPKVSLLGAIWKGLQKYMPQAEIFSEINSVPRDGLMLAQKIDVPDYHNQAFVDLVQLLQSQHSLQDLNQKMSQKWPKFSSYGDLYRAIWLLFQSNCLSQSLPYLHPCEDPPKEPEATPVKEKKKSRDIGEFVLAEHSKRMGKDYYRFLGLRDTANYPDINKICQKLQRTYLKIKRSKRLKGDTLQKLEELIQGVEMVSDTLLDPTLREEYNAKKRANRIELVTTEKISKKFKKEKKEAPKIVPPYKRLIEQKKYAEAYKILKKLLADDSFNHEILCDIGWVSWQIKKNLKEAEENLLLSTQLEKKHILSYQYLAQIYQEANEGEKAIRCLEIIVRLDSNDQQAKKQLQLLKKEQEQPTTKGWFRS